MDNLQALEWHTEQRVVKDLIPFEYNPRILSDERKKKLTKSLEKFNLAEIPAINTDNKIIAGHQRILVMLDLGRGDETIDVRLPNRKLTDDEFREYNVRSNVDYGSWDISILDEIYADLNLDDFGLDISALPDMEIAPELRAEAEGDFDPTPPVNPISQLGDLYTFKSLGKRIEHRLLCGDSTKRDDVKKLMQNDLANQVFTDPPYNVDYRSRSGLSYESAKYGGSEGKIFNDKKTDEDAFEFYKAVLKNLYEFTTDNAPIYWWYAQKNYHINHYAFKATGWHLSQTVNWLKENMVFSPGADFHRCFEPFLFGWKEGQKHYRNKTINNLKDVFTAEFDDYRNMIDIWYERRDNVNYYVHPTQKPVALAERSFKKHSRNGFIIADFFSGSGSTMIACEKNLRQARVIELDPKYADVTFRRIIQYYNDNSLQFEVYLNGEKMNKKAIDKIMNNVRETKS